VQLLFEGGRYRQTLELLAEARDRYPHSAPLQLWQAIALDAIGQTEAAIASIRPLTHLGDRETQQQARYLLSIWSAPSLKRQDTWMATMPDVQHLDGSDDAPLPKSASAPTRPQAPDPTPSSPPLPADRSLPIGWIVGLIGVAMLLGILLQLRL
jgi:hypothetical protein